MGSSELGTRHLRTLQPPVWWCPARLQDPVQAILKELGMLSLILKPMPTRHGGSFVKKMGDLSPWATLIISGAT
jgi:hypothetical protein